MISDHRTKSIVLAVRGSISLRDIFTDLVAAPEKIDVEGLPEGSMVSARFLLALQRLNRIRIFLAPFLLNAAWPQPLD